MTENIETNQCTLELDWKRTDNQAPYEDYDYIVIKLKPISVTSGIRDKYIHKLSPDQTEKVANEKYEGMKESAKAHIEFIFMGLETILKKHFKEKLQEDINNVRKLKEVVPK